MKNRLALLAATFIAGIGILGASQAQANVYCVASATPGTCTSNFTGSTTAVQAALTASQSNAGPDTIRIGTGIFTTPTANGDFELGNTGVNNSVDIVGEGSLTDSVLQVQNTDNQSILFDAGYGSTLSKVSISVPGVGGGTALWVRNTQGGTPPVVREVNIYKEVPTNNPVGLTGVELQNGATLASTSVDVSSTSVTPTTAVQSDGAGAQSVIASYLVAGRGVSQPAGTGSTTVSRSQIVASGTGVKNSSGTLNLNDSLLKMPAAGFTFATDTSSTSGFVDTQIDGSTIVGGPNTTGAQITANVSPTASARVQLDNSVMSLGGNTVFAYIESAGNTATFNTNHSAYDRTKIVRFDSSIGPLNAVEQVPVDLSATSPGFNDPVNDDFTPVPSSPLLDAGVPIDPPAGSLDLNGHPRACHGKADGVIIRDIGAFEYKTDPNDDCTYPAAVVTPPPGTITDTTPTIVITAKPGSTFSCSLDGGAFSDCTSSFTTPTLSLGAHDLKVRARDVFGNIQQVPTDSTFTIVAATCATDASLCPPATCATDPSLCPDKTAPKVTILGKVPKRTGRKSLKIRFKASEASSFTCKVNRAKPRKCKSPFKAKLKKGKNTITIVATDNAGNKSKAKRLFIKRK